MAVIIPVVSAIAASAAGTAIATSLGFAAVGIASSIASAVVGFAINKFAGGMLAKKSANSKSQSFDPGFKQVVRLSDDTQKIVYGRTRIGGTLVFVETVTNGIDNLGNARDGDNLFLHLIIAHTGHEIDAFEEIYLNDNLVTLDADGFVQEEPYKTSIAPYGIVSSVRIKQHLGSDDQEADPALVAEVSKWTSAHRLRGCAYTYMRLQWHPNVFPDGIPSLNVVIRGKKVYDPRTDTTAWSNNPALCVHDYLTSRDTANIPYGFGLSSNEIDNSFTEAAANICEENITKLDGSTIDRYTCNGILDTATAPLDNLESLLTSMIGTVTSPKGVFRIYAGAYDTPEATVIDESWLTGPVKSRNRVPRQDLFNAVRGLYVAPDKQWQSDSFPEITSAVYEAQDNGERIYTDISLPFTIDPEAAQRIAKIVQRKGREQISCTMPVNYKGLQFAVWDAIKVNNTSRGWVEKVFRIVNWTFDIRGAVVLQLREENSASYDWSASDAQAIEAAPDTNLPNVFTVQPPGNPALTESLYTTRDGGGVKAKATATWGASSDAFAREYQVELKLASEADTAYRIVGRTEGTSLDIFDIAPGRYTTRVKTVNTLGVSSAYAVGEPEEIYGLLAAPGDITGLTMQAISSIAVLRWDKPEDLDVLIGGSIEIRHSEATSGATWATSYSIGERLAGNATIAFLPLKAGTYLVRAKDSTGQYSVNIAVVKTKNATVLTFSSYGSVTEHAAFVGVHSNTFVESGKLKLSGSALLDDIADFDGIASFDYAGGVATSGTYNFAAGIDLGSVLKARLETTLAVEVVNIANFLDSNTNNMDDWPDFDGLSGDGTADAYIEVRATDDNPAGAPVWTDWNRLHAADYEARAFQFRAQLESTNPVYSIHISQLGAEAKYI